MPKLDKNQSRQQWRELRQLVNRWDPIGVTSLDGPEDEYDCLVGPVLRLLEGQAGAEAIAAYLAREVSEHFGLNFTGVQEFSCIVQTWYDGNWQDTTV
jgi:hypothetical protein